METRRQIDSFKSSIIRCECVLTPSRCPSGHERTRCSGVIAVLFLFVVGFIFATISLSLQVGQIVERRVATDQSADSAAYAMASKSAQGLNFIAANNLAIAGAAHMAGVVHLAADRILLVKIFFQAKSLYAGGSPRLKVSDVEAYDRVYKWFRPIADLYFRSGIGLTRLNSVIRSTFLYLGVVDAINIGSANAPSSLIIPFGWDRNRQSQQLTTSKEPDKSFTTVFIERLKKVIKNMTLKYDGLDRTYADETFCLAYETGQRVMPEGQHSQLSAWVTGIKFPILNAIGDVLQTAANIMQKLDVLQGWVGIKVGFARCGFGERGDALTTQNPNVVKNYIGQLLFAIVKGPMSGRSAPLDLSRPHATTLNPSESAETLAMNINNHKDLPRICAFDQIRPWRTDELTAAVNVKTGACLTPLKTLKKYPAKDRTFAPGTNYSEGSPLGSNQIDLYDYQVACHGTILFEWEAYSGLNFLPNLGDPTKPKVQPAKNTYPGVKLDDQESDLCPSFRASFTQNISYPYYITGTSHVNMSRGKPFLHEIVSGLVNADIMESPAHWRGDDPRPETMSRIKQLIACATRDPDACPQGYLENQAGDRFSPDLQKLDWLCPAGGTANGDMANIKATLKFDNPESPGRWTHSGFDEKQGSGDTTRRRYLNKFIELQDWHNDRVDQLIKKMDCKRYEDFASKGIVAKNDADQSVNGSNNYCDSGAHYCWQKAMQKHSATSPILDRGPLSFLLKTPPVQGETETPLESSLHYAVLAVNPLRTDNGRDIKGRLDNSPLAHCPVDMEVNVTLEDNSIVQVCDVQPVIGFIGRMIMDKGREQNLEGSEQFGGGDVNLASGGAILTDREYIFGTSGFMAISQSGVKFQDNAPGAPPSPVNPKSTAKNYQMFWPSWHPVIEPSRVMSRVMPKSMAFLVED